MAEIEKLTEMQEEAEVPKKLLDLTHQEARAFFLKHESYFNAHLPPYFQFEKILQHVSDELGDKSLNDLVSVVKPRDCEGVNHTIVANKDGKLSWRPLQLIHPVLYVNLVREITKEKNWTKLKALPCLMQEDENIKCLSLPVQRADDDLKDRAEQVSQWWQDVELKSVEYALDYEYVYETDITDCYGSFYTHSIAWAVEGKEVAKKDRHAKNLGNFIDTAISDMQHGQTNGIPQGSVLMDFIAEIILGDIDVELSDRFKAQQIIDFKILRYRDDYRVFVNGSEDGEKILKIISEVLLEFGLRLNSSKTKFSSDVVGAALKSDKKSWIVSKNYHKNLFKHGMLIKQHADCYPNSGSLSTALSKFHKRVLKLKELNITSQALISTIVDIAYKNPRTYPVCFAILSKFISLLDDADKQTLIKRIKKKFTKSSNVGYMEIWFQRATKEKLSHVELNEPLCKIVKDETVDVWNSDWIESANLKKVVNSANLVDRKKLSEVEPVVDSLEFDLFPQVYG
jgi:RNA-directed DNA polymerase